VSIAADMPIDRMSSLCDTYLRTLRPIAGHNDGAVAAMRSISTYNLPMLQNRSELSEMIKLRGIELTGVACTIILRCSLDVAGGKPTSIVVKDTVNRTLAVIAGLLPAVSVGKEVAMRERVLWMIVGQV
jgi:hypothetical protein